MERDTLLWIRAISDYLSDRVSYDATCVDAYLQEFVQFSSYRDIKVQRDINKSDIRQH